MQQHSSIGVSPLKAFLSDLVARNLASVLAANGLESEPVKLEGEIEGVITGCSESEPDNLAAVELEPEPVKLEGEIEGVITGCSDRVRSLAWRFARSSGGRLDVDDLYSVAMLEICECVAAGRLDRANNPVAYLLGVARLAMMQEWKSIHACSSLSLDAPLFSSDDDSFTLLDVLAAPAPVPVALAPMKEKERAVCSAVGRLAPRRRAVVSRRFGLGEYSVHSPQDSFKALGLTRHSEQKLRKRGLIDLGHDAELCAAVGLEVAAV